MLRKCSGEEGERGTFPTGLEGFRVSSNPSGIRFYVRRKCFYYPYSLLKSASFEEQSITLLFADATVLVTGSLLHPLFVLITEHQISEVIVQPKEPLVSGVTFVCRIERIIAKESNESPEGGS